MPMVVVTLAPITRKLRPSLVLCMIADAPFRAELFHADTNRNAEERHQMTDCSNCGGMGWVGENHQDRPWGGLSVGKNACECGAGAPCPICNLPAEGTPRLP